MKKKYLFINGAHKWNSLVYKFYRLYRRLRLLNGSNNLTVREYSQITGKMQKLYKRLEKMQYKVGLRIAGTALAVMLSAGMTNAQEFATGTYLQGTGKDINMTDSSAPSFADIDGDGDYDMYVGNGYGEVLYFENNGSGIYTDQGKLQADGSDISIGIKTFPVFADLDGDDDLDLYLGDADGKIRIYQNNGSGTFSENNLLQADAVDIDVNTDAKFTFADLDGDNDLGLYIGDYHNGGFGDKYGYIKYYQNNGTGTFTDNGNIQVNGSDLIIISGTSDPNVCPTFSDIDKDGDLDLYIASNNRNILYYENDGNGAFGTGVNMQADGVNLNILSTSPTITFADINGNGAEVLFIGEQEGMIEFYQNNGSGIFSTESYFQELLTGNIQNRFISPEFADIDGNGILDLYAGTFQNNLLFYENDGNMLFGFHANVKEGDKSILGDKLSPTFADIDNDGDLDLYIGNGNGNIQCFENDGNGTFTSQGNFQVSGSDISTGYPISPVFADIDNDGDLDLYAGDYYGFIRSYINNGSGLFTSGSNVEADGSELTLGHNATPAFADIDDEGDLDLFVGDNYGEINYYTNDGTGVFASQGLLEANLSYINVGSYSDPTFADIDSDGDLDLFVGNEFGEILYYKNTGLTSAAGDDAEELCSLSYTLNANQPANDEAGTWSIQTTNTGTFSDDHAYDATFTADATGTYVLRWSVTDFTDTKNDDVQITFSADDVNPTITCIGNQSVNASSSNNYLVSGTEFDPTETFDNCHVASVINNFNNLSTLSDAVLPEGTTTVQWTVTDDTGNIQICSFDIQVNAFVNIENIDKSDISIFPNPVKDFIIVDINNFKNNSNIKIRFFDILGKTVIEKDNISNNEKIDLSFLNKGIYVISIESETSIFTTKVIKN